MLVFGGYGGQAVANGGGDDAEHRRRYPNLKVFAPRPEPLALTGLPEADPPSKSSLSLFPWILFRNTDKGPVLITAQVRGVEGCAC